MDDTALLILRGAFAAFLLLALFAMTVDFWKFLIPNAVSVLMVALFLATALFVNFRMGVPIAWLSHFGAMAVVLGAGSAAYRFGVLGAGDVKLLAAVSLWNGLDRLPEYLVIVALCGGVLGLGLLTLRRLVAGVLLRRAVPEKVTLPRFLLPREPVPYGAAIALGGIYMATGLPYLGGAVA